MLRCFPCIKPVPLHISRVPLHIHMPHIVHSKISSLPPALLTDLSHSPELLKMSTHNQINHQTSLHSDNIMVSPHLNNLFSPHQSYHNEAIYQPPNNAKEADRLKDLNPLTLTQYQHNTPTATQHNLQHLYLSFPLPYPSILPPSQQYLEHLPNHPPS